MNATVSASTMGSVWITANAGSGKTTFLTRRVVALLLMGVEPERICCITYTKAAASEMRHRVLSLLRELLLADDAVVGAKLGGLLGRAPSDAERARARSLFGTVLDSVGGGLQLTTIHGFCQSILRRFPLEAGIAPHFTVLEDEAAMNLLLRAKHRLLSHYEAGDPLVDAAFGLIGSRSSESRFGSYVNAIIAKRGMWEELWRGQTPDLLRERMYMLHGLAADDCDAHIMAARCSCIGEAEAAIIRAHLPQLQGYSTKAEQEAGRVLALWLEATEEARQALLPELCNLLLTQAGTPRKRILGKDFPEGTALRQVLDRLAEALSALEQRAAALACAEESFAVAVLARALTDEYAQAKAALHALDYDDLIGHVTALFANPAMLGWVMSKLDHRIDHLLIDEAQDTSAGQWVMARLLVEELIAANEGVGSGGIPRSLLVVGDEKQSIYSFQGAAPELFAAKKESFTALLAGSPAPLSEAMLSTSYRSAQAVLSLVDTVAALPEVAAALSAAGEIHPHQLARADAAGKVVLYPPLPVPEKESAAPLAMPLAYQFAQSTPQVMAYEVAETVAKWLREGRMLQSEGRPLTAGDILILVRTRTTQVLALIRAFEQLGVPVAGLDRLTLSGHLAVRDLLALMRWVLNPADDLALAQVLRSPLVGMGDDALRAYCFPRAGCLWNEMAISPEAEWLQRQLANRCLAPYDFLTEVLESCGGRQRMAARFGEEVHEVLDELKQQAAVMPRGMAPTLAYFHDWLDGSARQIKREQESGESGVVRIMTVHGAKGLEAPVVLLVDTVSQPTTQHELFYAMPSADGQPLPLLSVSVEAKAAPRLNEAKEAKKGALLAEHYRLFYVALTRARDELHLWGMANRKGGVPEGSWYALAQQAMRTLGAVEIEGGMLLQDTRAAVAPKSGRARPEPARMPGWVTATPPMGSHGLAVLSPSRLVPEAAASAYVQAGEEGANIRGVKLHRVLELLDAQTDADTIRRLVAQVAGDWEEAEQQAVAAQMLALRDAERWIWENPSHAEASLSGTVTIGGNAWPIHGQVDRLVRRGNEVVILDYKTGRHVPANQHEVPESYRVQLKAYHEVVQELYPGCRVRCAILWTSVPQLMWCDEAVAATGWPNQFVIRNPSLVA